MSVHERAHVKTKAVTAPFCLLPFVLQHFMRARWPPLGGTAAFSECPVLSCEGHVSRVTAAASRVKRSRLPADTFTHVAC